MNVVIVESAAKAKTINKYLGSNYKVLASFGHVRDLPSKDGSVDPEQDFSMTWEIDQGSKKIISEITEAVKKADKLILATDPDREGEAISWHLLDILEKKKALKKGLSVERVAFNAVTKDAILAALAAPRQIDEPLVDAYLARRALDYLVGFTLSPVLWRKLPGARSAGRVQSVALRLVCDREAEIEAFRTDEYWTIEATLVTGKSEEFPARLHAIEGTTLKKLDIKDETTATEIKRALEKGAFRVVSVESRDVKRNPYAPFATSTLQMDASRKLGFSAKQTMQVAQRLYEGIDVGGETVGLITYMRTDGVTIIPEAINAIRGLIARDYSQKYVAPFVREYKTKAKNAQEAHEAIRPTDVKRTPASVARYLDKDQARLYELIWKRAVASQMASAEFKQTTADIEVKGRDGKTYTLRATGSVEKFDGFLKVYDEGRDDKIRVVEKGKEDTADDEDSNRRLPALAEGDALTDRGIEAEQHFTQPPPRYSEATLVKKMEELGIGRPSTYASTLAVLQERDYVRIDKKRLIPEDKGRLVIAFLESFFKKYVEFDFTADLEEKLDLISAGDLEYKIVLRDFWRDFTAAVNEIKDLRVGDVLEALNELLGPHVFPAKEDGSDPRLCPKCGTGRLSLKISGKSGAFIGCGNYPDCKYTRQLSGDASGVDGDRELGFDPDTGLPILVKSGRFGPYLQLGEGEGDEKPKRSSIPKGIDAANIDFEKAVQLLSLPREVGIHPETGTPITAGLGRYGPFVQHDGTYANVESIEDVFTVGLNRAVTLLAEKRAGKGGRFGRAAAKTVLKELGEHPGGGGKIQVLDGKYGPYVSHDKVNATVPKGMDPATLTVDDAVRLLQERIAKGGGKKKPARGKAAAKAKPEKAESKPVKAKAKAPAKKAPAKKAATKAKKPAAKAKASANG
ncbi:DNA topoisomerase I [Hyphomicrobium nitrativorans NL23]|uniref:DNA topoisomerase 1 n=1 Tax=Hyphomicrobium nitrativorans NL23 TaxID=1029756 RepID=V5SDT4_9HYPH|nr:type I DNA topoisomerase [Hyphomicrobium nitrativorans]AHB48688.1 DNA topoisomerase I [Hyphomicrobium nitrativorans NL23]